MQITRRAAVAGAAALAGAPIARGRAQSMPSIKLGVLTDLSSTYRDWNGPTSVACVRQAVEEFDPASHGFSVELIQADHQNKADIGATIARQWFDQGVDAIIDVPNSAVALAVSQIAKDKDKALLDGSASTPDLTDNFCNPNTIQWSYDTYMRAQAIGPATVKSGGKTWFFITADYTFGRILEEQTTAAVNAAGGDIKGSVRYPFPDTTDFSSYLLQAQASGAQVLALANGGLDFVNAVKQANEFGVNKTMQLASLSIYITDVHSLAEQAVGMTAATSFYWDFNDRTRAFTRRLLPKLTEGSYPNMNHASDYAMTLHYLKAVAAAGAANAKKSGRGTIARMKGLPTDDDAFGPGRVRADGRGEFPAYLWRAKIPSKPNGWDLFEYVATIPPSEAVHPLNPNCKFSVVTG